MDALVALAAIATMAVLAIVGVRAVNRDTSSAASEPAESDEVADALNAIWSAPHGTVVTCSHDHAAPRGLDPVTVTDGRVERVTGGAR